MAKVPLLSYGLYSVTGKTIDSKKWSETHIGGGGEAGEEIFTLTFGQQFPRKIKFILLMKMEKSIHSAFQMLTLSVEMETW